MDNLKHSPTTETMQIYWENIVVVSSKVKLPRIHGCRHVLVSGYPTGMYESAHALEAAAAHEHVC